MVLLPIFKELFPFFFFLPQCTARHHMNSWERITNPSTKDLFQALSSLPAPRLTPGDQAEDTAQLLMKTPIQTNTDFQ